MAEGDNRGVHDVSGCDWTRAPLPDRFETALIVASVVVGAELLAIAYIRKRYMDTPFLSAAFQVIVGGLIVLGAGILIGKS